MTSPANRLAALGYTLSAPPAPAANYVPVTKADGLYFVSGQISTGPEGLLKGTLGAGLGVEDGQKAAAFSAVNILSQLVHNGPLPLEKIRLLKLTVLVSSAPDFTEQHVVANGASDLLAEVLGDNGNHARAAFGVAALPLGAAVEIEAIAEAIA